MSSVRPLAFEPVVVVRRLVDPALLEAAYRLRVRAWAAQGVHFDHAHDGRAYEALDEVAEHHGIVEHGALVAAMRVSLHDSVDSIPLPQPFDAIADIPGPIAFLSRLAVREDAQDLGYGSVLTEQVLARAAEMGASTLLAFTTVSSRARHLRKLGFSERSMAIVAWGQRAELGVLLLRSAAPGVR